MEVPTPAKKIPCLKCGCSTLHQLRQYDKGCQWHCPSCGNSIHAFSFAEMVNTVTTKVFGLNPSPPNDVAVPQNLKVYLEHQGPDAEEKEASQKSVEQHIRLTGDLPKVGKPLYVAPKGCEIPAAAVPFGKVVRLERDTEND